MRSLVAPAELAQLTLEAMRAHRLRYALTATAVLIGVAAVVMLASVGEGTRSYVLEQFSQFGTSILAVNPGATESWGVSAGSLGGVSRPLTLDDARALRRIPGVQVVVPLVAGSARVEHGVRGRSVYVYGVTSGALEAWSMRVEFGRFLPETDWDEGASVAVLGPTLAAEVFGSASPLGRPIRIGEERYRVVGIMESKGKILEFDIDDAAYIPVARARRLFNRPQLDEIDILAANPSQVERVADGVRELLRERHEGEEDFKVTTQADMTAVFGRIARIVTATVSAIAGISLFVGAMGILTVMWIVVHERTGEIGLAMAVGARRSQIVFWYLAEAASTSLLGGIGGVALGSGVASILGLVVPGLAVHTPAWVVLAALGCALGVGLLAGILPAVRAARLDPVEALHAE
jgi:putative ABC transport system permease protein